MDLKALQTQWESLGKNDPLWAVLSHDSQRHGAWDLEDFFATGDATVDDLMARVSACLPDSRRQYALDFGCGVGRLSRPLTKYYDSVVGVDISRPMVDAACRYNTVPDRCSYIVNTRDDLSVFPTSSMDLVLSLIVLQHMAPLYSKAYIAEFVRLIRPGGAAVFQAPVAHQPPVDRFRLDPSGYQASIIVQPNELNLAPGETTVVNATVRNIGTATWIAVQGDYNGDIRFRLGKHIWAECGVMLPDDDDRTPLASDLSPGSEAALELRITAPAALGRYTVALDLVHEHVTWFADRGSRTSSLTLNVVAANGADLDEDSGIHESATPRVSVSQPIQMHCLSPWDVETVVRSAGGRIESSWLSTDSGNDWESRVYVVTR
jgi:SAM-dependent methyltransferase